MPACERWHFLCLNFSGNNREILTELGNVTRREVSLPLATRIDHAVPPDERPWAENAVAADFGVVANEGAEFPETS
jgi:hypothetical protein